MIHSAQRPPFPDRDFNTSPLIFLYEVTQACGLVCKHCRACAQEFASPDELTPAQSRLLIDQITEFPVPPMLVLTGGDPLCRDDIFELIDYAKQSGLDVSITPSVTALLTHDAVDRLQEAGVHRMAISIDGADAKTHDEMRGVIGSYALAMDTLGYARDIGLPTQVNTTITPDNIAQIDQMAEMLSEMEIALWSVFFLVPVGRADEANRLTAAEYEAAFEKLWRNTVRQPYAIKTTEAPHYRRFAMQKARENRHRSDGKAEMPAVPFKAAGVNDGRGIMFVSHTGLVYPSGFMPVDCGRFPQQHVVKVYQDSEIFRGLRNANQLEGKCRQCEYRTICGGSRARAYAVTGNPYAEEPDCAYCPGTKDELR